LEFDGKEVGGGGGGRINKGDYTYNRGTDSRTFVGCVHSHLRNGTHVGD